MNSFLKSFGYACKGLQWIISSQVNFRIHVVATVLVAAASVYFHISTLEWIAVFVCVAIVLSAEAFNSAIELLVDLVSPGSNAQAGRIKDASAAAVLIAAMATVIIGSLIFLPKLLRVLNW